jgi:hypothetical protein
MDEKTSHKDWALERERQEVLALRDERYRKNVWALVLILAVLVVDPFSGVGGLIGTAIGYVFPEPAPAQQAPKVRAAAMGGPGVARQLSARGAPSQLVGPRAGDAAGREGFDALDLVGGDVVGDLCGCGVLDVLALGVDGDVEGLWPLGLGVGSAVGSDPP